MTNLEIDARNTIIGLIAIHGQDALPNILAACVELAFHSGELQQIKSLFATCITDEALAIYKRNVN